MKKSSSKLPEKNSKPVIDSSSKIDYKRSKLKTSEPPLSKRRNASHLRLKTKEVPKEQRVERQESRRNAATMEDNASVVLMTWVQRKEKPNKNAKKTPKELLTLLNKVVPQGTSFLCCETFDTYIQGGLYPLLHISTDKGVMSSLRTPEDYLDEESLGENYNTGQAMYREVASVNPPSQKRESSSLISVAAFKSIDGIQPSEVLLREWKTWTGVRGFMVDILQAGLSCHKVKFYVKDAPLDNTDLFHYVVITEVGIDNQRDENLFIDVMQRFRVERWLGFRTVYKPYTKK